MDWMNIRNCVINFLNKNKFIILILILGLILLVIPSTDRSETEIEVITEQSENILSVEDQLSQILSCIEGAGKVKVMLSIASGQETVYQTNDSYSSNTEHMLENSDTVIVNNSDRSEMGLIRQVNPPVYSGAIVVCQGADDAKIRFAVTEAVADVTGLGTDKISVLKMK